MHYQGQRFLVFYCDQISHIYFLIPSTAFYLFYSENVIYQNPLTIGVVLYNIFLVLVIFVSACLCGIVIIYISQLHSALEYTNKKHVKLMHGMHEGLIILDSTQETFLFSNNPAKKLINRFFMNDYEKQVLTQPIFKQI